MLGSWQRIVNGIGVRVRVVGLGASSQAEVRDLTALRLPRFFAALRVSALRRRISEVEYMEPRQMEAPQ